MYIFKKIKTQNLIERKLHSPSPNYILSNYKLKQITKKRFPITNIHTVANTAGA